jgi:hypothetical protein
MEARLGHFAKPMAICQPSASVRPLGGRDGGTMRIEQRSGSECHNEERVMPDPETPSPRRAGKAAIVVVAAILLIVVAIFVGLNLQHAKDQRGEQAGNPNPATAPKTERDLGSAPVSP